MRKGQVSFKTLIIPRKYHAQKFHVKGHADCDPVETVAYRFVRPSNIICLSNGGHTKKVQKMLAKAFSNTTVHLLRLLDTVPSRSLTFKELVSFPRNQTYVYPERVNDIMAHIKI